MVSDISCLLHSPLLPSDFWIWWFYQMEEVEWNNTKLIIIGVTGPAVHTRQDLSWAILWSCLGVWGRGDPGRPLHWGPASQPSTWEEVLEDALWGQLEKWKPALLPKMTLLISSLVSEILIWVHGVDYTPSMKAAAVQIGAIKQVTKLPEADDLNFSSSIYAYKASFIDSGNRRCLGFVGQWLIYMKFIWFLISLATQINDI